MKYKDYIKEYKDFPIDGINYLDLNPIYKNGDLLRTITEDCIQLTKDFDFDYIGLVESRGFILGSIIAHQLGKGVVLLRSKKNRLPGKTHTVAHTLEYGESMVQVQEGEGKVLVFDDVLATGGTLKATNELAEKAGYKVVGNLVLVDLKYVPRVEDFNLNVRSVIQYD